ncbi:MAG: zinc-ribbon domain-containing protein [Magnetococcales bacterium]|nr:zinc-ribbon domain-containing protein [Magnetococcales bacterium]
MIVQCKNCASRFDVAESLLGTSGRKLKCSRCKQVFFQPGITSATPEPEVEPDIDLDMEPESIPEPEPEMGAESEPAVDDYDFSALEEENVDLDAEVMESKSVNEESKDETEDESDDFSLDSLLAGTEEQSVDFMIEAKEEDSPSAEPEPEADLSFDDISLDDFDPNELTGLQEEENDLLAGSGSPVTEEEDPLAGLAMEEPDVEPKPNNATDFFSDHDDNGAKNFMAALPEPISNDDGEPQQSGRSITSIVEKGLWGLAAVSVVAIAALWATTQKEWVEYKLYDMQNPIRLESVSSRWRASLSGGKILVVEGKISNTTQTSHNPRVVRVSLLDRNQQSLQDNSSIPDRILSDQDLSSSENGLKAMVALQRNPQRMEVKKLNAGRVAPFQVVFINPPQNAYTYRIDLEEISPTIKPAM